MMEQFVFSNKVKRFLYILMGIGVLALIIAIIAAFAGAEHMSARIWSAILTNNMFFLGLGLGGLFFVAAHYLAYGGWYVLLKRVPEAMSYFIPVAGVLMLFIIIGMWGHFHHIYHWTDKELLEVDPIVQGKQGYLNIPFFTVRYILYFGLWTLFAFLLRRASVNEDKYGGLTYYKKSKIYAAVFIIIFAVTSSTMSWDFVMSINVHWYSTLFGWYNFATIFVSAIAAMILLTIYLKSVGYLPQVNQEHLHDLGKFLFAFSIFWTYLWFSQYMLIWYSNIGEETEYFKDRVEHYPVLFYANVIINFIVPFFALMTRDSKRKISSLVIIASIVFLGHWLDYFLMVTPGATNNEVSLGIIPIALFVGYLGLFIYVVFYGLTKASMVPVNHPFYKESIQHHT